LLDELTDADWDRISPDETEETEEPDRPSDEEVLAAYTKDYSERRAPLNLASRWKRLGGALLDGIIMAVLLGPIIAMTGVASQLPVELPTTAETADAAETETADGPQAATGPSTPPMSISRMIWYAVILFVIQWGTFFLVNGYLLFMRGQTVGKLVVRAKIVNLEGEVPNFAKLVILRYILPALLAQFPLIGLIDVLMIFGKERRCLHDYMAGTRVVNV
jgi:uncharacterized RDD family membrane protein YckC